MKFIPHGAAREVTGTCHEIQVQTPGGMRRVLLDACGGHVSASLEDDFHHFKVALTHEAGVLTGLPASDSASACLT